MKNLPELENGWRHMAIFETHFNSVPERKRSYDFDENMRGVRTKTELQGAHTDRAAQQCAITNSSPYVRCLRAQADAGG